MKFEVVTAQHIDELVQILEEAKVNMERQNIYQWNNQYPDRKLILSDIDKQELYILKDRTETIVCMGTFSESSIKEITIPIDTSAVFIKRLIVKANTCGQGLAKELIDKYIDKCKLKGRELYSCTNHTNLPMQRVLEKMNFRVVESFVIEERKTYGKFHLYYKKVGRIDDK